MKRSQLYLTSFAAALLLAGCQADNSAEKSDATQENGAPENTENESADEDNLENNEDHQEEANDNHNNNEHDHDHENDHGNNDHNHDNDHDHNHSHDDESQAIYDGYFEDDQIEDRELSDWEGEWQSVYLYLMSGELDEVMEHKAAESDSMTAEEYTEYYETGYETDVDYITIEDNTFTFKSDEGEWSGDYAYDGYEILTYEAGNRGVRFIFEQEEGDDEMPAYIQFSDHNIYPTEADHFHLYWGDDREELLDEVTNWPTYYPAHMDGEEIKHEMIAH
ncbi:metal-binding protein ZinT [Salipaludibacillus aurantiacus]|uniref:Zinc transport system substrate-binding protein n=1 Tax=Salipaludibacillus aurantiacus TaxID=1601833 RepID=A0A1H9UEH6_9BACI|nr:metal-binding protein ZinT [Salipaludibacillus aurantiacus]SES07970.1 zinc transport system substrate-binding protein [Salipaludibacillus aurantiacus]